MLLTLIFLLVWVVLTLGLRALVQRLFPAQAQHRGLLLAAGVVALALTWPLMQHVADSSPAAVQSGARWPEHARVPLPRRVAPAELARLPLTTVSGDGLAARGAFVEASRRRPVARMALRLADEATRPVQRFLVLRGDTLELVVDERRRENGDLYALPLGDVALAACTADARTCSPLTAEQAASTEAPAYRILARFPEDTAWAVRF